MRTAAPKPSSTSTRMFGSLCLSLSEQTPGACCSSGSVDRTRLAGSKALSVHQNQPRPGRAGSRAPDQSRTGVAGVKVRSLEPLDDRRVRNGLLALFSLTLMSSHVHGGGGWIRTSDLRLMRPSSTTRLLHPVMVDRPHPPLSGRHRDRRSFRCLSGLARGQRSKRVRRAGVEPALCRV